MIDTWKSITLEIIEAIKEDNIDRVNELLDKRQEIIADLKTEINLLSEDRDIILDLDNEIKTLLQEKMEQTKDEIKAYNTTKKANYSYQRNVNKRINIFNEKI